MTADPRLGRAAGWALIGGVLLASGHFSGAALWVAIFNLLPASIVVQSVAFVIVSIAGLGGIAVTIAGLLFLRGHRRTGRSLIGFGAGFSLLSLLFYLASVLLRGPVLLTANTIIIFVGLFVSIQARRLAA